MAPVQLFGACGAAWQAVTNGNSSNKSIQRILVIIALGLYLSWAAPHGKHP